ncbi:MAG: glycosyltransferase family 2 protein [Cellvibrionaceae bacterium]|nr:glycosyltransferase family 2 protein [Cellvibrionaceae bacterium]
MPNKAVDKYLRQWAAAEAALAPTLAAAIKTPLQNALLIPAKDEAADLIEQLLNFNRGQQKLLLVLLINQAEHTEPSDCNRQLWQAAVDSGEPLAAAENCQLLAWPNGSVLLLVDRFNSGRQIAPQQGVGLARKIAADLIVALKNLGKLDSDWIYSSDADCRLPGDYFCLDNCAGEAVAAHFNFSHGPCLDSTLSPSQRQAIEQATELYEQGLHYYQAALSRAGSPYSFFSIGSCLAFRWQAYCQVRGFPSRAAGEDFYLLNKLAKQGPVYWVADKRIQIQSRLSQRAPFGTGPAVADILHKGYDLSSYPYYHPQVFIELRTFLQQWQNYRQRPPAALAPLLSQLGWDTFCQHCQQQQLRGKALEQAFHTWFDGFKTLKFIHWQRDQHWPNIPLQQGIDKFEC